MVSKSSPMPLMFLKHRGTFNLAEMMKSIQDWYVDNGYKYVPLKYKMKADEAEYEIIGERDITEYVRFKISLHIWVRELREVEVVQDGEKKKMNSGIVNLDVGGELELDYNKRFGGNKFFQWLQDFYHNYVIRQTISDVWEDDLFLKMVQLMGLIKKKLGIEVS